MHHVSPRRQIAKPENYTPRQLAIAQTINHFTGRKAVPGLTISQATATKSVVHNVTTIGQKPHQITLCGGEI